MAGNRARPERPRAGRLRVAQAADAAWLERAVALAVANVGRRGGPFAAVVVRDGEEVARGFNRVTRDLDPTAHAEMVAIRTATRRLRDFRLTGCTLVCSCEPCPMCLGAALWARLDRVIYAADRDDAAAGGFDDRAFHRLLQTPRSEWPMPVERLPVADPTAPFDTWLANSSRISY